MLFLNHNVRGTGTFQRAFFLARGMAARGHAVTLVTTSRTARLRMRAERRDGIELLEAPDLLWSGARQGWGPVNALRRIVALRGRAWDLVHAFDCRPAVLAPALVSGQGAGARLVMDWADWWGHGGRIADRSGWLVRTFFGPVETWFEEAFRGRAAATTVASGALRARAAGLGLDPEWILHVPNGCDPALPCMERAEARARLGVAADGALLAYLGRSTAGEMALLTDGLRVVRRRHPDARLVLIGEPRVSVPADLERSGAVLRTGYVSAEALALWLGAADLGAIAMPDSLGNRGRWPGKLNDYLSAGRPVAVTRVGDAASLVEARGLGWVADADAESFGGAVAQALDDACGRVEAGRRARLLAEGELSWGSVVDRVERFYRRIPTAPAGGKGMTRRRAGWA